MIFPSFQLSGTVPRLNDVLYIIVSGFTKASLSSLSILGCNPSGPGDLFTLRSCSSFNTSFSWNFSKQSCSIVIGSIFGISPSDSLVNTLLNKFASTSAFSLSVDVLFSYPFSFLYFSSDIPDSVFLFEFAYCQNFFGFIFAFFAISFSIFALAFLTNPLTWFLILVYSWYFLLSLVSMYLCQHLYFFLIFLIILSSNGINLCFFALDFALRFLLLILSDYGLGFSIMCKYFAYNFKEGINSLSPLIGFLWDNITPMFLHLHQLAKHMRPDFKCTEIVKY